MGTITTTTHDGKTSNSIGKFSTITSSKEIQNVTSLPSINKFHVFYCKTYWNNLVAVSVIR